MKPEWYYANGRVMDPVNEAFFNIDSETLYYKNLRDRYEYMKEAGWVPVEDDDAREVVGEKYLYNPDKPAFNDWINLSYDMNSHGFRIDQEMPNEKKPRSIITLGCSCTFGVGMPVGQIWPTLVGQSLRVKAYNLGVPLGSLDQAFRLLLAWLPKLRSKNVFLLEPPGVRYETITHTYGFNPSSVNSQPNSVPFRYEHEDEWTLSREKTMRAMRTLCDQFDVNFYHMPVTELDDIGDLYDMDTVYPARDLQHPGRKQHIYAAMRFLKMTGFEWDVEKK